MGASGVGQSRAQVVVSTEEAEPESQRTLAGMKVCTLPGRSDSGSYFEVLNQGSNIGAGFPFNDM